MKRLSQKSIFVTVVFLIAITSMLSCASYLYNKSIEDQRREANLTIKSVDIPDFKIVYAEGGTGDTIIMLHGNGGSKDSWLSFAKYLTPNYRVIIPDLPGMGDSSKPLDKNYNIMSQMERLHLFARELKLPKFHLVGHSMGGVIVGNYAATYPQMVKTLALFASGGVKSPMKSELTLLREKGINPFVIKNENDFDRYMKMRFVKPPPISPSIKEYSMEQLMKAAPLNEKIGKDILSDVLILESKLNRITAPTLIVWGDSDKVLSISSVPIFEKNIKNSRSAIIKDCGHVIMIEKPAETASIYQDFLKGQK
ncbi:MAG TPA: alpha/beta hydrolase [Syntrophales bacterium]|nr:alpha/beta hydrolase [Syntrophales bacterium]